MATKAAAKKKPAAAKKKPAAAKKKPAAAKKKTAAAKKKPATVKKAGAASSASKRIDEHIASIEGWRGERFAQIRRLIHEVDPDVVEEWKWRGAPVWSHNGMFAVGNAFKDKVKVTFHHGAKLKDPKKLFNAGLGGGTWRSIDLFEGDVLDERAFKALLREAMAYNDSHSVPKSRGSNV